MYEEEVALVPFEKEQLQRGEWPQRCKFTHFLLIQGYRVSDLFRRDMRYGAGWDGRYDFRSGHDRYERLYYTFLTTLGPVELNKERIYIEEKHYYRRRGTNWKLDMIYKLMEQYKTKHNENWLLPMR